MRKDEPFEADLVVIRRNPWMVALAFLPALLPPALALAGMGTAALFLLPHGFLFTVLALAVVLQRNPLARLVSTKVSARDGRVRVGSREFHRKEDLVDGLLVPRQNARPRVVFKRRGLAPKLEIEVVDTDQGRQLLRAVGFDASQTVASFRLAPLMMTYPKVIGGVIGGLAALLALTAATLHAVQLAPFLFVPVVAVLLVTSFVKRRVEVGSDGVLVGWFGKKRFIAHSRIADVQPYEEQIAGKTYVGVDLHLVGGEKLHLVAGQKGWVTTDAQTVAERIREAREDAARGDADVQAALLDRGTREIKEWVSSLRGIGAGANASLRTAPVAPERLWRIVEDAGAEPTARAGAAVALGAELDDERSARLRGVAQTIAAPRLRVAIEHVAEGKSDAELEQALAEMDDGARERTARR
jgi:hypothetical protein